MAWGAGFGALFYGLSTGATVAGGIVWGFVVWTVMYQIVLPALGARLSFVPQSLAISWFEHIIFGAALGVSFLPYQHRVSHPHMNRWAEALS